jgi:hypothetical protein
MDHKIRLLKKLPLAGLLLALVSFPATSAPPGTISPIGNAEDLQRIPGSTWVLASGMRAAGKTGGIYAIAATSGSSQRLFPSEAPLDESTGAATAADRQCPGGPDTDFAPHGINLQAGPDGLNLHVVNHGSRESIEIFSVTLPQGDEPPTLNWIDCIPLPSGTQANSVTAARDGTLYVTAAGAAFDETAPPAGADGAGAISASGVLAWQPQSGWRIVADGLAVSNGLLISADNRFLYAAEWLGKQIVEIDLGDPRHQRRLALDFGPDNLRWDGDGTFWVAGQTVAAEEVVACYMSDRSHCELDSAVALIDSTTLSTLCRQTIAATEEFGGATVALPVADTLWIGTFRGNAILVAERAATTGVNADCVLADGGGLH